MNENYQKVQQIILALQMNEQVVNPAFAGQYINTPTIKGSERISLITELVTLLTTA